MKLKTHLENWLAVKIKITYSYFLDLNPNQKYYHALEKYYHALEKYYHALELNYSITLFYMKTTFKMNQHLNAFSEIVQQVDISNVQTNKQTKW